MIDARGTQKSELTSNKGGVVRDFFTEIHDQNMYMYLSNTLAQMRDSSLLLCARDRKYEQGVVWC